MEKYGLNEIWDNEGAIRNEHNRHMSAKGIKRYWMRIIQEDAGHGRNRMERRTTTQTKTKNIQNDQRQTTIRTLPAIRNQQEREISTHKCPHRK